MTEIVLRNEEKQEEKKVDTKDIAEVLRTADEYNKLKEQNDKLEREYLRQQELKAKINLGGRALGGVGNEKTPEQIAEEEAKAILKMFR